MKGAMLRVGRTNDLVPGQDTVWVWELMCFGTPGDLVANPDL
jgi:hypothetical protein